jgi:protein O-mannosyl-transferase
MAMSGASECITSRRVVCIVSIALAVLTLTVFARTLGDGFVNYDDNSNVYENPFVTNGLTKAGMVHAFTKSENGTWDPLTTLSHMADCQMYGLNPAGHHLTNVLLHTASVILLFILLHRMTGALWPSAFVAALFAIHPLRVESVAWVSERKDTLSGLFFLLTLWAYVKYVNESKIQSPKSKVFYILTLVLFALGLLSKAMLVTLPVILLLLDYWPLKRFPNLESKNSGVTLIRLVIEKLPLFTLSLAACVIAVIAQRDARAVQSFAKVPFGLRVENAIVSVGWYVGRMFWPARLAVLYPYPQTGVAPVGLVLGLTILIVISTGAILWRRTKPYILIGWLWYLIMLAPVIGMVQLGQQAHADRYTYLPEIGLYIALAWAVADLFPPWPARRMVFAACAVSAIIALSIVAVVQTSYWHDSESLWRRALACTSENAVAHYGLGLTLVEAGKPEKAVDEFQSAVGMAPDYAEARNNLGYLRFRQGRMDDAITQFQAALLIQPDYAESHNNLGLVYHAQGRLDDAIDEYLEAGRLKPDYAEAHFNLANIYNQQGHTDEATAEYEKAIELRPNLQPARQALRAIAWVMATNPDTVKRNGPQALKLAEQLSQSSDGNDVSDLATLAAAYAETGKYSDAVKTASQARQLALSQNYTALAAALQRQIELYQAGQPLRDISPPTGQSSH